MVPISPGKPGLGAFEWGDAEPGVMGKITESGLAWPLMFSATLCVPDALPLQWQPLHG